MSRGVKRSATHPKGYQFVAESSGKSDSTTDLVTELYIQLVQNTVGLLER